MVDDSRPKNAGIETLKLELDKTNEKLDSERAHLADLRQKIGDSEEDVRSLETAFVEIHSSLLELTKGKEIEGLPDTVAAEISNMKVRGLIND